MRATMASPTPPSSSLAARLGSQASPCSTTTVSTSARWAASRWPRTRTATASPTRSPPSSGACPAACIALVALRSPRAAGSLWPWDRPATTAGSRTPSPPPSWRSSRIRATSWSTPPVCATRAAWPSMRMGRSGPPTPTPLRPVRVRTTQRAPCRGPLRLALLRRRNDPVSRAKWPVLPLGVDAGAAGLTWFDSPVFPVEFRGGFPSPSAPQATPPPMPVASSSHSAVTTTASSCGTSPAVSASRGGRGGAAGQFYVADGLRGVLYRVGPPLD